MASSLNETPAAERVHIGLFGCRNAGKSSLINALTGQDLSIVSDFKGTTTDPVSKAMEILPLGPVLITDTPGLDDEGALGEKRVKKHALSCAAQILPSLLSMRPLACQKLISVFLRKSRNERFPTCSLSTKSIYTALPSYLRQKRTIFFLSVPRPMKALRSLRNAFPG